MDKNDFAVSSIIGTLVTVMMFALIIFALTDYDEENKQYKTTINNIKLDIYLNSSQNITHIDKVKLINKSCAESFNNIETVTRCRKDLINDLINGGKGWRE